MDDTPKQRGRPRQLTCKRGHSLEGNHVKVYRKIGGQMYRKCMKCETFNRLARDQKAHAAKAPKDNPNAY